MGHYRATTGTGKNGRMALRSKRLMGFEPTTFCMASRRSSQLSYSRTVAHYRCAGAARLRAAPVGGQPSASRVSLTRRSASALYLRLT